MQENPLKFPKAADKLRRQQYVHYDEIYAGQHFNAFKIKAPAEMRERYAKLRYIAANFGGLMSRVVADMLFTETLTIDAKATSAQEFITELIQENQLITQFYESALVNSRRGDSIFKIRVGKRHENDEKSTIIIEEVTAYDYFATIDRQSTRNVPSQEAICTIMHVDNKTYLHKEIHVPGKIINEVWGYNPDTELLTTRESAEAFGFKEEEETGVNRSLVFHIPNVRDGNGFYGTSDYSDLDPLFFALNNRLTSVDNILDKHSDPILAVPTGVIDENGKVKKEALNMFEVDNENPGFNKPEFIVWNANLEAAFKQIESLVKFLFMFSEIAPSSMGMDDGGGMAESGRALKFKLLSTIRKRNRKRRYYDQVIKDMIVTSQELSKVHGISVGNSKPYVGEPERPNIKWPDGIVNDNVEDTELAIQRVGAGIMSRADAISQLDDMSPEDAKKKVKEIDDEEAPALDPLTNNLDGSGTGGAGPNNPAPSTPPPTPPNKTGVNPPVGG